MRKSVVMGKRLARRGRFVTLEGCWVLGNRCDDAQELGDQLTPVLSEYGGKRSERFRVPDGVSGLTYDCELAAFYGLYLQLLKHRPINSVDEYIS